MNTYKKLKYLIEVLALLVIIVTSLPVTPAFAISNPDSILIDSISIFQNLWEAGDQLYVVEYEVNYATTPTEDASDAFFVGIWDGTTCKYTRPLDYYQHNITSIYLSADNSLTWDGAYTIRVSGNPSLFTSITEDVNRQTYSLSSSNWTGGTSAESPDYLANWCVHLAEILQADWSITLLTSTNLLNSTGATVFQDAIPGLGSVCSTLFQVSLEYPAGGTTTGTPSYANQLSGNTGIKLQRSLEGLSQYFLGKSTYWSLIGAVGLLVIYFILAGRIFTATGSTTASIVMGIPFLLIGAVLGLVPLAAVYISAILLAVIFGVVFILGRMT